VISFRDPIHGDHSFDGVIEELIKTEEFQRLADIKQLGLTDKVYTGATHTRLAHAIGVCYLAGEMARRLGIPPEDVLNLRVAALLHDIGHYDFSHALEPLAPCDHEENSRRMVTGRVKLPDHPSNRIPEVLLAHGIDPTRIAALLAGRDCPAHYASILSSRVLDADRMDYLKRDTYYTGAVIGEIDISRLLRVLVVHPETGRIGVLEKGVPSMEQFLIARAHMYQQVYLHPDSFAAEAMLRKAVAMSRDIALPFMYGDERLLARLAEHGGPVTRDIIRRIRAGKRSFHAAALLVRSDASPETLARVGELREEDRRSPGALERRLLRETGLPEGSVIVTFDLATGSDASPPPFPVLRHDGSWADLFSVSPLARAVMLELRPHPVLAVHAALEARDAVARCVSTLFDAGP